VAHGRPARATARRIRIRRIRAAGLLALVAAIAAALGYQLPPASSPTAASHIDVARTASPSRISSRTVSPGTTSAHSEHRRPLGQADGAVPDGTTVYDDGIPGVANLDPALLLALRRAATDAAGVGVEFFVDSGWRSVEY